MYYSDEDINKLMNYPIEVDEHYGSNEKSILGLVSNDRNRLKRVQTPDKLLFTCQFETARKLFEVIESKTKTILVPYNSEAKEMINIILSNINIKEKYNALTKLQSYSVNIFNSLYQELLINKGFIPHELDGIYILSEEYYHYIKGVTSTPKLKINIF